MLSRSHPAALLRTLLLVAATTSSVSAAQGLNLSWSNCYGEATGTQNRNFSCTQNTGASVLVGSFVLASDMADVVGAEVVLELASASAVLPHWWQFRNAGTCRQTAMSVNFVANPINVVCQDWDNGQAIGGVGAYCTTNFPCINAPPATNMAIIKLISAVAPEAMQTLTGGVEYFDFNLVISHTKTVSTSCTGCDVPVCIVLNSINVVARDNVEKRFLATPTGPGSNFVTWQGGGVPVTPLGSGCPAATPTRQSTWGAVKSLYR